MRIARPDVTGMQAWFIKAREAVESLIGDSQLEVFLSIDDDDPESRSASVRGLAELDGVGYTL